ncbi:MAG: putative hydroxymethylpyrimidine transport system substrate-binding protein [Solirubrobacteraceae bacterium]|nr:putative hydroxymethylpyrimidine transport system substrate-binding protein [Solirubrobacteraceae bacterium]
MARNVMRQARALVLVAGLLAGCGGSGPASPQPELTLALDFTPNAVHAPIYAAVRAGLDRRAGVRLKIRTPGQSPDSLKDVLSGAADLGILDIHDLGLAVEKGKDVVAVAALVERPLAAIITSARIGRPRDLEGRRVGVSGLPSDPAVLDAVMGNDGGDYRKAKLVTIGFAAVQSLVSGRIDGVPAFWNAEGVALHARGVPIHEFRVDDYGAPRYPEVVLVTRRSTLTSRGAAVRAAVRAITAGIADVRAHPGPAIADIARASGAPAALVRAQLAAVAPILGTELRRPVLEAWASWDAKFGVLPSRPDVTRAFALG